MSNWTIENFEWIIQASSLSQREKYVLWMRLHNVSHADIAKELPTSKPGIEKGVTRERVRQLEARAMRKLRTKLFKIKVYE